MTQSNQDFAKHRVAYFISPHGFGHAARATSVMEAIYEIESSIRFEIFTRVPSWFFQESLSVPFSYHSLLTDIGMVQKTPLREDLSKTIQHLDDFLPFEHSLIDHLARQLKGLKCELVICDIAPMGILAAQDAGISSVLVENFTWDWIYQGYASFSEQINNHIEYLARIFDLVSYHIQTEPVCLHLKADLLTLPVSRKVKTPDSKIRRQLRIPVDKKVILITMGGIPEKYTFVKALTSQPGVYFIIPGGSESMELSENLILLPYHSDFYHPDLVNASDVVIGKLGYSTLAEVYHAGVPFGYICRLNFRESKRLASYIEREMPGISIQEADFHAGNWVSQLPKLLALQRTQRRGPNGSEQIATYICELLKDNDSSNEI
jgi:UDP-N-acetylglucosamine:LPS N-acetylglucosamine transferase